VVGDQKYGSRDRDHPRLALHARSISFNHPYNGQRVTFESKVPIYFNQLVGKVTLDNESHRDSDQPVFSRLLIYEISGSVV
jgi:tRNA pseudouridine32 synthase/23S rRNA pseudouridine746 synthase/23S rRNA pseudouridine1911/1915/1917 synthase